MSSENSNAVKPVKVSKRSELHKIFQDFVKREDVQKALGETVVHKRAGLLKRAFKEEKGLDISANYVYRVMRNRITNISTVKIGDKNYEIIPISTNESLNNTIVE